MEAVPRSSIVTVMTDELFSVCNTFFFLCTSRGETRVFCPHLVSQSQTFEWDTNNSFHTMFKNSWQPYFAILMRQTRINDVFSLKIKLKEGMQYRLGM